MEIIFINLLTMLGMAVGLIVLPWVLSRLIPNKFLNWYLGKRDNVIDLATALLTTTLVGLFWYMILRSHINQGPVIIDATYFHEDTIELVVLGTLMAVVIIHSALQYRILRGVKK